MSAKLTARAVNNADYQAFTEKSLADVEKPWQSSAIGDGKLCLTAGKPQSGVACGKSATINYVPRSGTTLFDVFDADILCGIRFSAGFAALHQRLSIVKHLRRFHRNIYNHLIVSDINRSAGVHAICHNECLGIWFYCFRTPVCEDRHFLLSISKFSMAFFGEMVSEIWWLGRWCFRKYLASLSN